jgi:non-specific serine/threonine protein kinase
VPPPETHLSAAAAIRFDAVRLLVERARSGDPRFTLTDEQVPTVCTICRRLDGLPLALELAAARLRVLSLDEVAARLDDRFSLLGAVGRPSGSPRQRSLRAAVEWSYDLLSPAERLLFQRLSVFAGSFRLPDVEAVCVGGGLEARDVVDLLGNLVAKSLVVRLARASGPARFRMLETLRLYAHSAWLSASGEESGEGRADARIGRTRETASVLERHAAWFSDRCEEASSQRTGPGRRSWLQRLDEDRDDWRAALAWLVADGEPDGALRLATSLWRYWDYRSLTTEGRTWLDRALARPGGSLELRRRALAGAAYLALVEDDLEAAHARCQEGLDLPGGEEDPAGRAALLAISGEVARLRGGQAMLASELCGQAQELFRLAGDAWGEADALRVLVLLAWDAGDLDRARMLGERCLQLWDRCGDSERCAGARSMLAGVARDSGDLDRAAALYEESLAQFRRADEPWGTAQMIRELGTVALAQGRYERAHHLGEECLAMQVLLGKRRVFALALRLMADAAVQLGRLEDADRHCAEALERFRVHQLEPDVLLTLRSAALIALCLGDLDRAVSLAEAAGRDTLSLRVRGTARCRQRRLDQAAELLDEALRLARQANDARSEAAVLDAQAEMAVMAGAFAEVEVADRRRTLTILAEGQPELAVALVEDEGAGVEIVIDLRIVPTQTVDVE